MRRSSSQARRSCTCIKHWIVLILPTCIAISGMFVGVGIVALSASWIAGTCCIMASLLFWLLRLCVWQLFALRYDQQGIHIREVDGIGVCRQIYPVEATRLRPRQNLIEAWLDAGRLEIRIDNELRVVSNLTPFSNLLNVLDERR